jgi:flagellar basal-body rod modification protein FlgD
MSINTINEFSSAAAAAAGIPTAPTPTRKTAGDLGIDDFLHLMSTQLQNQDPLKPMDSTAFVAQLAQFGTVSGVQKMQDSLASLSSALQSSQMLTGASLVGHTVQAQTDTVQYGGSPVSGLVTVPDGAGRVELTVTDASGQTVRHMSLSSAAGTQRFTWDGKSDDGASLGFGQYRIQVTSRTGQGNASLATSLFGAVGSVSLDASGAGLTLNTSELGAIALGKVQQII